MIACKGAVLYELKNRTAMTIISSFHRISGGFHCYIKTQAAPSPCVQYAAGNMLSTQPKGYNLSTMFITNKTPSNVYGKYQQYHGVMRNKSQNVKNL